MRASRRSLRTELLFNLGFLTSAAVILVGGTTLLLGGADPRSTLWALGVLWLGSTAIFVLFGAYLVQRLILRPLRQLSAQADRLAAGDPGPPPPALETEEFAHLGERFQAMADDLLDAQSQVVRAEKLAGVGRLAAGVAHEIRNPLGALGNYVDVLRKRGADPEVTDAMRREIERVDRIVEGLLAYARPPGSATGRADLNATVETTLAFLEHQGALRGRAVTVTLDPALPAVRGDRHALEQVVVNLVLNACDAVPEGRLWVGTAGKTLRRRFHEERRGSDPAREAGPPRRVTRRSRPWRADLPEGTAGGLLFVADEGPGVPDIDRERVFDPFFTTKDPGRGTGLGLAIVARTVHESGGVVWVDRAREGGAVFKVFLPLAS